MAFTDYVAGGASTSPTAGPPQQAEEYWPLSKLKKAYTDYLFSKREELDEQKEARRYYHCSQWTDTQVKALKKRNQPIMTFNRVGRKIDGVVGLIERLRQDPKAYPRTPKQEEGADLATAVIRYVLDEQDWKAKSPEIARDGAIDGIGGLEINIEPGDHGDPEITFDIVEPDAYFYDPRCYRSDFSDARYQGVGKWLDSDVAQAMFPAAAISDLIGNDYDLTSSSDREMRWFRSDGVTNRVRIVDIWYKHNGGECYAIFTGNAVLMEGHSYLKDEKGKDICKYIMFSGNVDQDGDRYGFVRNIKSAQDGVNAKQSKMQHILASNKLFVSQGAAIDIEKVRAEYARSDGVIVTPGPVGEGIKADDRTFDFTGWAKLLELNLNEIENFGPNPALIGQGIENKSGRAIQLLQQAGMAELGPYITAYRGWKIRVYRAIWCAVQQHWQAERWIRVTDSDDLTQFLQVNQLTIDPMTGQPTLVNALGNLDVDIIIDEGPDQVNQQADAYDTLQLMAGKGQQVPPMVLIELSPLDGQVKKRIKDLMQQAAEAQQPQQQLQMADAQAEIADKQAAAQLKGAQTLKTLVDARVAPMEALMGGQTGGDQMSPQMEMAEYEDKMASAFQKRAAGELSLVQAHLRPAETIEEALQGRQQLAMDFENAQADRAVAEKAARNRPPAR